MTDNDDFGNTDVELVTRECTAAVLHTLNDPIEISEMFPNESSDAWIFGNRLIRTVRLDVSCGWTFDWDIVNIQDRNIRDFRLKNERYVIMEDRDRIGPSHW